MKSQFHSAESSKKYMLAGNAKVTFVSQRTGTRFTYLIDRVNDKGYKNSPHFVSVLTGIDYDGGFTYLGCIFYETNYRHGRASKINLTAPSARAFTYVWSHLTAGRMPPNCDIYHEGTCGRCGRSLTVPASIERGLGPECATK